MRRTTPYLVGTKIPTRQNIVRILLLDCSPQRRGSRPRWGCVRAASASKGRRRHNTCRQCCPGRRDRGLQDRICAHLHAAR